MQSLEHYRKQFNRATEKAFSYNGMDEVRTEEHLETLFKKGETKFNRTVAILSMLRNVLPEGVLKFKYQTDDLPFDPDRYEFIEGAVGRGGENDVYRLEAKAPGEASWALKINHQDKGDVKNLTARAKTIRQDYEMVRDWYEEIDGLVPREWTIIMAGPRDGKPAITTLQEYYGNEIRDVFKGINQDDLAAILAGQPQLKEDFENFIRISRERTSATGDTVDLLGDKNLSLISREGEDKLILLDPHLISNPWRNEEEVRVRLNARMEYLEQAVDSIPQNRKYAII
jgi:hypothetical protein